MHELQRLVYASRALPGTCLNDIESIIESADGNNSRNGVTGALFFGNGHFLQFLEGRRDRLSETLLRIASDERHYELQLLDVSDSAERWFQGWAMRHINVERGILERITGGASFEPFNWSADTCYRFFREYSVGSQHSEPEATLHR